MSKVVLIVEDNDVFRRGLERLVVAEGYEAHAFASAEEAVDATPDCNFDLALLDIRLPGMYGDELAELLKRRCACKPIAFVTSEVTAGMSLQRRIPGCRIMSKPVDIPQLVLLLHELPTMPEAGGA